MSQWKKSRKLSQQILCANIGVLGLNLLVENEKKGTEVILVEAAWATSLLKLFSQKPYKTFSV